MPLYKYRCTSQGCGHQFEELRSYDEQDDAECELCGGEVESMITQPTVITFKPFVHPHMDFDPQPIESKRDFYLKCKQFGVSAPGEDFSTVVGGHRR